MAQRYFVDAGGNLVGSFDGLGDDALTAILPAGAIEVPGPPPVSGRQRWSFGNGSGGAAWVAPADSFEDGRIDSFAASPEGRAIVRALAEIKGIDEAALLAELKQNAKG